MEGFVVDGIELMTNGPIMVSGYYFTKEHGTISLLPQGFTRFYMKADDPLREGDLLRISRKDKKHTIHRNGFLIYKTPKILR